MRRPSPFGRHPFIAFTATVLLAVAASVATLWLDSAAPAADTLLQRPGRPAVVDVGPASACKCLLSAIPFGLALFSFAGRCAG